ncbi:hypothetical protein [Pseudonocardia abyssalis]|uniref:Uncharacterized protein n=1 Tax=Pseudonocardia abyssalis TaxID=2792008 RepID=A0ABS6UTF5_9PSEU|nr:hypothetical protein [Pseudonocardia abyssalis]MBW0115262.1 hypothetical protein [Pseudonocardia abyssalis]MBW0135545.1 hypothetical protein [Pseudonocardia abyssalis]
MTLGDPNAVGAVVLVAVFVVGVLAGLAKQRLGLLLVGLVAVVVLGLVVAGITGLDLAGPRDAVAVRLSGVYAAAVPPAIAFVAGWLATRGTWFRRALTVGVAVLVLAAFPYAAAGAATAGALVP